MLKVLCQKDHTNKGEGGGGFTQYKYYKIESFYKNPKHDLMINFTDDMGDTLQLSLEKAEKVFDLTLGTFN